MLLTKLITKSRTGNRTQSLTHRVGSILDFSFDIDIDTGQKTSDSILIFLILVESVKVKIQWMSEKKHLAVGWGKW